MSKKITTISICGKTSDACNIIYKDADGEYVGSRDGYVPDFMPGEHYGDYIELLIDVETGQILNWKKPTQKVLKESME